MLTESRTTSLSQTAWTMSSIGSSSHVLELFNSRFMKNRHIAEHATDVARTGVATVGSDEPACAGQEVDEIPEDECRGQFILIYAVFSVQMGTGTDNSSLVQAARMLDAAD